MGHVVRMTLTGAIGITFVFLVDAAGLFWVSRLGDARLVAAIGYAFAIQFFSVSAGIGLMIAASAIVSRSIGAGDRPLARRQATSSVVTACIVQFSIGFLIVIFRHPIIAMSGATGDTAAMAARYLVISLPSLGVMAVGMICSGVLRANGDAARAMFVTLSSGAFAMVMDPVLILGLGLELDGAALGLVMSRFVMAAVALHLVINKSKLMARPRLTDIAATFVPFMAIGIPAVLTQMATPVGNYLLTMVMAPFGDEAVAGWAVIGRLTVVAFGGIFSLSGAIGGIFGQNYGAHQYDRLRSTYRDAIIFGLVYTLVAWALLMTASEFVIAGFALLPQGASVVRAFTHVGTLGFIFASGMFVSSAAFNALGKPGRSTFNNWVRDGVLTLPLGLWLAGVFGAPGVIYAQALASVLVGIGAAIWGWRYVTGLAHSSLPALDLEPPQPYAHPNRFRRR